MSGKALLDAIYASPSDLAARAVYADWLLDRGDPRGELITLQLRETMTKAQDARVRALVATHAEAWIGRLTEITTWIEFERGFLARCGLSKIPKWAIGRREWATVTHIGISDGWSRDVGPLVTHAIMRSLESLRVPSRALEAMLGASHTAKLPVRRLTIDGSVTAKQWAAIETAPLFARVDEVETRSRGKVATWKRGEEARHSRGRDL